MSDLGDLLKKTNQNTIQQMLKKSELSEQEKQVLLLISIEHGNFEYVKQVLKKIFSSFTKNL